MADSQRDDEAQVEAVRRLPWSGPTLPAEESVRVEYANEPGTHLEVQIAPITAGGADEALKALTAVVGEKDARALAEIEAALFKWLREAPDRPARFLSDPLACLRELGVKLSEAAWAALAKRRDAQARSLDAAAFASISSVRVTAARARKARG